MKLKKKNEEENLIDYHRNYMNSHRAAYAQVILLLLLLLFDELLIDSFYLLYRCKQ